MYLVFNADKDAYITDRVIKGVRRSSANTGEASTLDLFKLYGITSTGSNPNIELTRLLVHFDTTDLTTLFDEGKIDPTHSSFSCHMKLFDVYGGQPTPENFTVVVNPLSRSFDEGNGDDVVYYADNDVCNFLTGSRVQGAWLASGCNYGGGLPGSVDFITSSQSINAGATSLSFEQDFVTGEEDLYVDVTHAVSASLAGLLPDEGFRIAFTSAFEDDNRTYFVKRFASRHAYNTSKRPRLIVRFDDSKQDDSLNLRFDSVNTLFMHNYAGQSPANLRSGSAQTQITGQNSVILRLVTQISGGTYELAFTGSQHRLGVNNVTGVYSASFFLSSSIQTLSQKLAASGSVAFTPIWGSLDGTVGYYTGSIVNARNPLRSSNVISPRTFTVSVYNVPDVIAPDSNDVLRVHIVDDTNPLFVASRVPVQASGAVIRDVHYSVRNAVTNEVEIPFDTVKNSTRISSDGLGMYFRFSASALSVENTYIIDILVKTGDGSTVYKSVSPTFKVSSVY